MAKKIIFYIVFIILTISTTGCMSLFPKEDEMLSFPVPSFASVEYKTVKPKKGDIVKSVNILGIITVDFEDATGQYFNVNGYIDEIYITNEQYVQKGDLIALLQEPENREQIERVYTDSLNAYVNIQNLYSKSQTSKYDLRLAEINLAHAKEKYDELIYYLNSVHLYASKSGYVTSLIEVGKDSPIGKTVQLCSIAQKIDKKVQASSTADNVTKMPKGKEVTLIYKDKEYAGYVASSSGNNVTFKSDDMSFMNIGQVVEAYLVLEQLSDVLLIPKNVVAMIDDQSGNIRVLSDNAPMTVEVKLGLSSGSEIEVLPDQGIDEDTLIISGVN